MLEFLQAQPRILFSLTQLLFGVARPVVFNASFVQISSYSSTQNCRPYLGPVAGHPGDGILKGDLPVGQFLLQAS